MGHGWNIDASTTAVSSRAIIQGLVWLVEESAVSL